MDNGHGTYSTVDTYKKCPGKWEEKNYQIFTIYNSWKIDLMKILEISWE